MKGSLVKQLVVYAVVISGVALCWYYAEAYAHYNFRKKQLSAFSVEFDTMALLESFQRSHLRAPRSIKEVLSFAKQNNSLLHERLIGYRLELLVKGDSIFVYDQGFDEDDDGLRPRLRAHNLSFVTRNINGDYGVAYTPALGLMDAVQELTLVYADTVMLVKDERWQSPCRALLSKAYLESGYCGTKSYFYTLPGAMPTQVLLQIRPDTARSFMGADSVLTADARQRLAYRMDSMIKAEHLAGANNPERIYVPLKIFRKDQVNHSFPG